MADRFIGSVTLRGANGKTASVRYALQPATYAEAKTALDAIVNELVDVTDATVTQKNLTFVYGESGLVGGGDIFEKATVACHTNLDTEVSKYAVLNVPAPTIAIFLAAIGEGRDELDIDNTDIQAYVAAVADNAFVSDGEEINTSLGAGGIKAGGARFRPLNLASRRKVYAINYDGLAVCTYGKAIELTAVERSMLIHVLSNAVVVGETLSQQHLDLLAKLI